jgi:outer membrane protein assembly factor BamB
MRRRHTLILAPAVLAGLAALSSPPAAGAQELEAAWLAARSEAPAEAGAPPRAGTPTPELLFSMTGADNAVTVRSVADVTGDGRDEVLVGIDESGTDNLFCLDGGSRGTATVVWSLETTDGVSGGSPSSEEALFAVSDQNADGSQNLLFGTAWGGRTAYDIDSDDGEILWRFDTYDSADSGWVYSLAEMSDVDGDGITESVFGTGSDSNSVYMIDGASLGDPAAVAWRYAALDAVGSVRNLGDADGDGDDDVLAAVWDNGQQVVALSGGTSLPEGDELWTYAVGTTPFSLGIVPDLNADGVQEALVAVWAGDGSAARCLDGATGGEIWASTTIGGFGMVVSPIADLTGDSIPEVVVGSWENAVSVLDGGDGSEVWKTFVGTTNGGDVWTARAIADLDGDSLEDVIAGSFDGHVYAMSGADGALLWAYDTGNRVFSVFPVDDLDGDGRAEVIAGTQDTTSSRVLYVLSGGAAGSIFSDGFESGDTGAWSTAVP